MLHCEISREGQRCDVFGFVMKFLILFEKDRGREQYLRYMLLLKAMMVTIGV